MKTLFLFLLLSFPYGIRESAKATEISYSRTLKKEAIAPQVDSVYTEGKRFILDFYRKYMNTVLSVLSPAPLDSLLQENACEGVPEKLKRMMYQSGGDPVIRAQDSSEQCMQSLSASHQGGLWYEVSYHDDYSTIRIPIRIRKERDKWKIVYITPIQYEGLQSDSLFYATLPEVKIGHSSAKAFLSSFYVAYTNEYATLQKNTDKRVMNLREKYLTPKARSQFRNAAEYRMEDGEQGYDLLLCDFDFDPLRQRKLRINPIGESSFQVSFPGVEREEQVLTIQIISDGSRYYIDHIKVENGQ